MKSTMTDNNNSSSNRSCFVSFPSSCGRWQLLRQLHLLVLFLGCSGCLSVRGVLGAGTDASHASSSGSQQHQQSQQPGQQQQQSNFESSHLLFPAARSEQYTFTSSIWRVVDPSRFSFRYCTTNVVNDSYTCGDDDDDIDSTTLYSKPVMDLLQAAKDRFVESLLTQAEAVAEGDDDDDDEHEFSTTTSTATNNSTNVTLVPLDCLWIRIGHTNISESDHGMDESYQLNISNPILSSSSSDEEAEGHHDKTKHHCSMGAQLSANTVFGILHGLVSLRQLLTLQPPPMLLSDETDHPPPHPRPPPNPHHHHHHHHHHGHGCRHKFYLRYTPLLIDDAPRFPHRGLLIDTSRHYLSVALLLDIVTSMAWNKLNVLHWHVTDSQSWPLVLETLPELSQQGAYCGDTCVYTRAQVQHILKHAWYHGIRVIPEVDVPGHVQAIGKSHPEWLSPCGNSTTTSSTTTTISSHGGMTAVERRSEPLDPTNEQVYQVLLPTLYHELSTKLFPNSSIIHLGGDEVGLTCWQQSPTIQQWMQQHNITQELDLWKRFEQRLLLEILPQHVPQWTRAIVWQEVFNAGLLSDLYNHSNSNTTNTNSTLQVVVDVWKGLDVETIQQALQENLAVLVSGCWYLDHLDQDWANLYKCNILSAALFNSTTNSSNNNNNSEHLLWGGHASMWGERVDETNFMGRVWPRASAVAERLWSGYYNNNNSTSSNLNNNNDNSTVNFELSVEDRLDTFRCFMIQQGIPASPIRPGFCKNRGGGTRRRRHRRHYQQQHRQRQHDDLHHDLPHLIVME